MRDYKRSSTEPPKFLFRSSGTLWDPKPVEPLLMDVTTRVLLAVLVLALVAMLVHGLFEALDRTAEIQERYYSAPVTATFERPAAYRLASPTADQMDHLHALRDLQPLVRR